MKKFLVLSYVFILLFSFSGFAKSTSDFEDGTTGIWSTSYPDGFTILTAVNLGGQAYEGSYSLMAVLTDTSVSGSGGSAWAISTWDATFLSNLVLDEDTVYWYVYCPTDGNSTIETFKFYTKDNNWLWQDLYVDYTTLGTYDVWHEFKSCVEDSAEGQARVLPIREAGVEIGTADMKEPGDTLYFDCISSEGSTSGVELITSPNDIQLPPSSINCINLTLAKSTTVLAELYSATGQRVAVPYTGILPEGPNTLGLPKDLANGVYVAKISVGQVPAQILKVLVIGK